MVSQNTYHPAVLASIITNRGSGDRTIITHNPEQPSTRINIDKLLNPCPDVLMLDGFYPETAVRLAEKAKKLGIPVVFDGGSWKPWLSGLLPYIDYAICSADFMPPDCQNREDVFQYLSLHGILNSAITRGEKSIIIKEKNNISELSVDPVIGVVDTLGAGDAFHGAFCFFLLKHLNFSSALKEASKIAGLSCKLEGTRDWLQLL